MYLVDGVLIGVSKRGSKEVVMYIKLTGVDFSRELSSMTDAEPVRDGASQGQSATDWQSEKGSTQKPTIRSRKNVTWAPSYATMAPAL